MTAPSKESLVKDYNEKGFASVLDEAVDLIARAAAGLRKVGGYGIPPAASVSYRREISVCLVEAEELIAAVRKGSGL